MKKKNLTHEASSAAQTTESKSSLSFVLCTGFPKNPKEDENPHLTVSKTYA